MTCSLATTKDARASGPVEAALPALEAAALFFDVDGTLLEIKPEPDAVFCDDDLRALLARLLMRCQGAVALVSGRRLDDVDRIFSPLKLTTVGLHGAEMRDVGGAERRADPRNMDHARQAVRGFVAAHDGLMLEDKGATLAVHYRRRPELGAMTLAFLLRFGPGDDLAVQEGKFVVELKPARYDKGAAIAALMGSPPFKDRRPVFFGDDLTDETGFAVVNGLGGLSVRIGDPEARTQARFVLSDCASLRAMLWRRLREALP